MPPTVSGNSGTTIAKLRLLPAATAFLIVWAVLVRADAPVLSVPTYVLGLIWQVVVPGALLHRALAGRPRTLLVELGMASVVGLAFQLIGWFVMVGLGIGWAMILWPLVVVVPFVLSARLRPHLSLTRYLDRLHPLTSWGLTGAFLMATVWFSGLFDRTPLPPAANDWYQDLYYHLSLSGRFLHQVRPMTPQVAGEPLVYHWFANAHMAASALATFQDMPLVLNRLFILPVIAITITMLATLVHELTGAVWPAVVAALLTVVGGALRVASWYSLPGSEAIALYSPSQIFSLPIFLFVLTLLVRLLRAGRLTRGQWVLLVLALTLAAGAKSSSIPLIVCGLLLALALALLSGRPVLPMILALLASLGVLVVTAPLLGGGGSGAGIQVFSTLRRNELWASFVGLSTEEQLFPDGTVLPGLQQPGALTLLALIAAAYVVMYAWLAPGLWAMRGADLPVASLLLGVGIGGFSAMMLIDHDGLSQVYFMNQALVAWYALAAWGIWVVVRSASRYLHSNDVLTIATGATFLGGAAAIFLQAYGPATIEPPQYLRTLAVPIGLAMLTVLALVGLAVGARQRGRPALAAILVTALSFGLLGATLIPRVDTRLHRAPELALREGHVTAAETAAARWLREHSDPGDVVATNVHCLGLNQRPYCDARSFWVGGFSERQILIEGWGYTDEAHRRHGQNDRRYANQPFHDTEFFQLNKDAFTQPSPEIIDELASRGVRWLFADTRRAAISPDLGNFAHEAHRTEDVVIFSIQQP